MTTLNTALMLSFAALGMASAQPATAATSTAPASAATAAAPVSNPSLTQVNTRTTTVAGKPVSKTVDSAMTLPGDSIKYTVRYSNNSKFVLKDGKLSLPVPTQTTFVSQECNLAGSKAQYSVTAAVMGKDGKISNLNSMKYGDAPLKKTVTVTENGKSVTKEVEVSPSEYTAVRWMVPALKVGNAASCSMTAKVK